MCRKTLTQRNWLPKLLCLENRLAPAIYTWTGLASNQSFEDANNWVGPVGPGVPGVSDDVVVPSAFALDSIQTHTSHTIKSLDCSGYLVLTDGTFTVGGATKAVTAHLLISSGGVFPLTNNLDSGDIQVLDGGTLDVITDSTLTNLTVTGSGPFGTGGGQVTGAGNLSISGPFTWNGGTLHSGGKLILPTGSTGSITNIVHLGRVLENHGTISVTDPMLTFAEIRFGPSVSEPGTIDNAADGVFNIEGSARFGVIENAGAHAFNNAGKLNHSDAAMTAGPSGSGVPLLNTGTINNSSGTLALHYCTDNGTINVTGGTFSFLQDSSFSGPINISAGALVDVDVGTLTCNPGAVVTGAGTFRVLFGTLNVASDTKMTNVEIDDYSMTEVTGAGNLTISGKMTWLGAKVHGSGKLILSASATGQWAGDLVLGRVVDNYGIVTLDDPGLDTSALQFGASPFEPGTINNLPGATFTVDGDGSFVYADGTGNVFNNSGTFKHTGASGTTTIDASVLMHNTATINVAEGVLRFNGAADGSGPMLLGVGASLIAGGTLTTTASASVTGPGKLTVTGGGTLDAKAAVSISNLSVEGGTVMGAGDVMISQGFYWSSGMLRSGGKLITSSLSLTTLPLSGPRFLGRVWDNSGTVNEMENVFLYGASPAEPGTINNLAGGVYAISMFASFIVPGPGPQAFNNAGTVTFSGPGMLQFFAPFTNTGSLSVNGGTMQTNATVNTSGSVTVLAGAKLQTTAGTYDQSAGTTTINGTLDPFGNVDIKGGTLRGTGTVVSKTTNAGAVSPGNSPGILTVNGNYSQTGTLDVELDGTTAGSQYDQLVVNGTVTLGGSLTASLGYTPSAGAIFVILANDGSDTVSGTFTSLPEGATTTIDGENFTISYKGGDGNDVTLTQKAAVPPTVTSVVFGDGTTQRSLVKQIVVTFSESVTFSGSVASAFTLHRSGTGGTIGDVTLSATPAAGPASVVTITFSGVGLTEHDSLIDGFYDFTISAAQVSGAGGALDGNNDTIPGGSYSVTGTTTNKFFRLFGDSDGDAITTLADFAAFRSVFNLGANAIFDFDNDGNVGLSDFAQFRGRFNLSP